MKRRTILLNLFVLGFGLLTAQTNTMLDRNSKLSYNIPPRHVFMPKQFVKIDYSKRLQKLKKRYPAVKDFMAEFTEQEMQVLKMKYPKDYNYYREALDYFNSLSKKIRKAFSKEELWYIYQFDQDLKAKLLTIK